MVSDYQEHLWPSYFGFQEDFSLFQKSGRIHHSVVDIDFNNGAVRSILLSVGRHDDAHIAITANYLYHSGGLNFTDEFFRLDFEKSGSRVKLVKAQIFG